MYPLFAAQIDAQPCLLRIGRHPHHPGILDEFPQLFLYEKFWKDFKKLFSIL